MVRPNIVYLHSHDTGRYVQPYGYAVRTPNIQRLAEQGILFRQAHSAAPTCSPSRAALLTGMCPHSAGQYGLVNRGFELPNPAHHIVNLLGTTGYHTTLAGLQHVRSDPSTIGYHQILETDGRKARDVAPVAASFITERSSNEPFFLTVGFSETHRPFPVPAPVDDARYLRPPVPMLDTPETRGDMAGYQASLTALDHGIGVVLGAIEKAELASNTLVICTTDHGLAFPRMKCDLTDHGTGVMLICRGPAGFSGGQVNDALISQIDLFPTICDLVDVEQPRRLQGKSLMPLVRGEVAEVNDEVYAEATYHVQYEPQRMIRTKRWKYIRRYLERGIPLLANCDSSSSKEVMLEHGWANLPIAEEQLYDLVFDPNEASNVSTDSRYGETLIELRERLLSWMKATNDPILDGPIPAPEGAAISRPDDRNPWDLWEYTEQPPHFK